MGIYINPRDMSKEAWLAVHGIPVSMPRAHREDDMVAVCLVDNFAFTAAGVCFSQREFEAFAYPDGRPREWFMVPIADLIELGAIESAETIDA